MRYGSQGDASSGTVMSGAEWSGSRGELQYVAVNRGVAGHVKAVMSRFGFACCGVAVEASPDAARHGLVR